MNKLLFIILLVCTQVLHAQTFRGTVIDHDTKKVIKDVNLHLPELNIGTVSDDQGVFALSHLPKGKFHVEVTHLNYQPQVFTINTTEDQAVVIELKSSVIQAEGVTITSGNYSTQHQNALRIESISSDDLVQNNAPDLIRNLQAVPGVDLINKGNGINKPVIRGLTNSNILFLNDGIKLENFQFSENHPYLFDDSDAERIEIIKGPASLLYGSDAVGGLINVIGAKPAPVGETMGQLKLESFSASDGRQASLLTKGSKQQFYWIASGSYKTHKDYENKNEVVPNSRYNTKGVSATAGINTKSGNYELQYDYFEPQLGMTVAAVVDAVDTKERDNKIWYQDLTNHLVAFKSNTVLGKSSLATRIAYQNNHRQLYTANDYNVDMIMENISYDIKYRFPDTGKANFLIGTQGSHRSNENGEAENRVLPDHHQNDAALYSFLLYPISEMITLQAGIRGDFRHIDIPEQESAAHSHEEEEEDHEEDHEEELSPAFEEDYFDMSGSAGLTYHYNEKLLLRFNLSSGYRTPNIAEIAQDGIHGSRYELGNRDLTSQRNYQADLNLHFHGQHFLFDVAAYYNYIDDYIYLTPTTGYATVDETDYQIYQYLQHNANIAGLEAGTEFNPAKWFNVKTTFAWIRGKFSEEGDIPFIPQNKWRLFLTAKKDHIGFLQNTYLRFSGLYALSQDNPANLETASDDYLVVDFSAGAEIAWGNRNPELGMSITNLFDEYYIDHLSTLKSLGVGNMGRSVNFWLRIPF